MTFEQLEAIVAVAREGTILAAAESLNISHPSVSRAISTLEDELGVNIFLRTRRGSVPTEQGKLILQCAQEILHQAEQLRALAGIDLAPRELVIKAFPIDSMGFITRVISRMKEAHEHVTINFVHSNISKILEDLKAQKIDFGLAAFPSTRIPELGADLKYRTLCRSRFMIACSGSSPLAQKAVLSFRDLEGYRFIFHNDPIIMSSLKDIFSATGLPDTLGYSNDNSLIKRMVAENEALSIYTQRLEDSDAYIQAGKIVLRPFRCAEGMDQVTFMCLYNGKKQFSPIEQDFLNILGQETAELR